MDIKKAKIAVTPTSFGKNDPSLRTYLESRVGTVVYNTTRKPLKSDQLIELIADADGYIAGLDEIDSKVLSSARKLKVISRYGVGLDNVDLAAAVNKNIVVTNTPGANASAVADLAVAFLLLLCRPICWASNQTKLGEWPRTNGLSLDNKTVGLFGFGAVAMQVAAKLKGFNCRLIAYDVFWNSYAAKHLAVEFAEKESLISESDFLSLHVPVLENTRNMVNSNFLNDMKTGSYLINTARGELINESALAEAIQSGKLAGAALDAFQSEPPEKNNQLLKLPHVITTPHMGAHSEDATNRMGWMALEDCLAVLEGKTPSYPVKFN
jgi:phosphoglycerate dehydrogenase-like enzyme